MLKLLDRNVASVEKRLVLVTPPHIPIPGCFNNVTADPDRHRQLVREMQRLRGSIYLQDGAVRKYTLSLHDALPIRKSVV